MEEVLTEDEYDEEVRYQADQLATVIADEEGSHLDLVVDVINGHEWFNGPRSIGGASFGRIVSEFNTFDGSVAHYRDDDTVTEGESFQEILRSMAFAEFEADVITAYQSEN